MKERIELEKKFFLRNKEQFMEIIRQENFNIVEKFSSINLENANIPYRNFVAKEIYNKIKIMVSLKALLIGL